MNQSTTSSDNSSSSDNYTPHTPDLAMIVPKTYTPSKFRYIWIGIILFLVLSVVGVGAFVIDSANNHEPAIIGNLLTPTPDTINPFAPTVTPIPDVTSGWFVYTNTKVGFQIKSLKKPQVVSGIGGKEVYADGSEDTGPIFIEGKSGIYQLVVFPYTGSLEDLFEERRVFSSDTFPILPALFPDIPLNVTGTVMIDSVKGYAYKMGQEDGTVGKAREIHFVTKTNGFIFRRDATQDKEVDEKEMEQILATFKFITPLPASSSAKQATPSAKPLRR